MYILVPLQVYICRMSQIFIVKSVIPRVYFPQTVVFLTSSIMPFMSTNSCPTLGTYVYIYIIKIINNLFWLENDLISEKKLYFVVTHP